MKTKPYIGITGVTCREQVEAIVEMADRIGLPRTHQLMIGVLASYRSLVWGELADPHQYVQVEVLNGVFVNDRRLFNLVHYNSRADGLVRQLVDLVSRVDCADGVQLNIPWPAVSSLRRHRERAYTPVVLQISHRAYCEVGGTPERLVERLRGYAGVIEYVLFDPSGGLGKDFDGKQAESILAALVEAELPFRYGVAGGLAPGKLQRLKPLLEIYSELSWDAQGGLRNQARQLDLGRCRRFLEESYDLIVSLS